MTGSGKMSSVKARQTQLMGVFALHNLEEILSIGRDAAFNENQLKALGIDSAWYRQDRMTLATGLLTVLAHGLSRKLDNPASARHADAVPDVVRLLAPFDPVVWDRRRFEAMWGWAYRFEAYTPAAKRIRGHYALPLLWRDQVIGWGNLAVVGGQLQTDIGWVAGRAPRAAGLKAALTDELGRMHDFLGLSP